MIRLFRHIRRQPKNVRDNYAVGIAASFTAIVFVFWGVAQMDEGFSGNVLPKGEATSPFATLIKESKEHLANIKNSIGSSSDKANQTAAVVESVESSENDPTDLVLTPEDLEIANKNATTSESEYSTTTATTTATEKPPVYQEVMIETTTSTTSKLDNPSNSGSAETSS